MSEEDRTTNVAAFEEACDRVDEQSAIIANLQHARLARPEDPSLKDALAEAFAKLEHLEEDRARVAHPFAVAAPSFSADDERLLAEARRIADKYR